jgi:hypothetical protein
MKGRRNIVIIDLMECDEGDCIEERKNKFMNQLLIKIKNFKLTKR